MHDSICQGHKTKIRIQSLQIRFEGNMKYDMRIYCGLERNEDLQQQVKWELLGDYLNEVRTLFTDNWWYISMSPPNYWKIKRT